MLSRLRPVVVPGLVRAASFPPQRVRRAPSAAETAAAIDPAFFLDLRQRIIERHNAAKGADLDEPNVQHFNTNLLNIRRALDNQDIPLLVFSWRELQHAQRIQLLTPSLVDKIANTLVASSEARNDSSIVAEVALAAASLHAPEALSACLLSLLQKGEAELIFDLYAKYQQSSAEAKDDPLDLSDILSPEYSCQRPFLLGVVAAYALRNSFPDALREYIKADFIELRSPDFEDSLRDAPELQAKAKTYLRRLHIARTVHFPTGLGKHVHNLTNHPSIRPLEDLYNSIITAMSGPDPFIAPDPERVSTSQPIGMTEYAWAVFLVAFLRRNRADLAAILWEDISQLGVRTTAATWTMVMDAYCDSGSVEEVIAAWNAMHERGITPTALSYRVLLESLFKSDRLDEALRWFEKFESQFERTAEHVLSVYNTVLNGLLLASEDENNAATAFALLDRMRDEGPHPDVVSYNMLMTHFGKQRDFQSMATLINRMGDEGFEGDTVTYTTILNTLLLAGRSDAPDLVLSIMRKQGVKPNVQSYTSIIAAQVEQQTLPHLRAAFGILEEMEKSRSPNALPNEVTYTTILASLYRNDWLPMEQRTLYRDDILARLGKRKLKFHLGGYNILIKACLAAETGLEDALRFYRDMQSQGIVPGDVTFVILLRALRYRGEWGIADGVIRELQATGAQPSKALLKLVKQIVNREQT